ncbi:L-fucose/L-arabinose isomerase family protein [Petrotoga sp. 9PWA.NaAc.5.4]|uniref:L-fucose/L-arabinose isomerase family protein n=1 Tax=Petrotoga sp. 9PWA.NaAc.5.4 TaxID=1434328 RepID=UPI000CBC69C6|nr:fucose isomerase [Petrotoga sp. 9PWA.NaAc.5.4]PNR96766.1 fucose isomerase [Petrotoga sp. 9PWA.NaAc.5.4]
MKENINLGMIGFVRNTYDVSKGQEIYDEELGKLKNRIENINLFGWNKVVEYPQELDEAIKYFKKSDLDAIILMSSTFHLGQLAIMTAKSLNIPMLIWALPEPPYDGGRVRLNSLVGAHLDCSNLYKSGFDNFEFLYGQMSDNNFYNKINVWIDTVRIVKKLKNIKIGLIGNHAQGFYNIDVYEPEIVKEFGAEIEYVPLNTVFSIKAKSEDIKNEMDEIKRIYNFGENMTEDRLEKVANLSLSLKNLENQNKFNVMAIRCWPEFGNTYGISPCASMSYFMGEHIPVACEGDIEGALGMSAYKAIGCDQIFLADISQIFEEESSLLLWHCGVAPYNLWDEKSEKTLDKYFAGGRGVTAGFVLKPGPVTISRIDYARGKFRLLVVEGEAIPTRKNLKGTFVKVKIPNAKIFTENIISKGFSHHVVLGYGNYVQILKNFAKIKHWEVFE